MAIENCDFCVAPVSMANPLVLLEDVKNFHEDFLFLTSLLGIGALDQFLNIFKTIVDILEILEDEFAVDDLHIADRVN